MMVIEWSHRDLSKPYCGKDFSDFWTCNSWISTRNLWILTRNWQLVFYFPTVLKVFEYITKAIKKFIGNTDTIKNIYGMPVYDTIISSYFCIEFIAFICEGITLLDNTILFSPN